MTILATAGADIERCPDCGDALRDGDDVLCRWCADNRARHPGDYAAAAPHAPEAAA